MTGSVVECPGERPAQSRDVARRRLADDRAWHEYGVRSTAMDAMRRTKIVATIGPRQRLARRARAHDRGGDGRGAPEFLPRTPEEKAETAARLRTGADGAGPQVAILQDLPSPKLRTGHSAMTWPSSSRRPSDAGLRDRGGGRCRAHDGRLGGVRASARAQGRRLPHRRHGAPARRRRARPRRRGRHRRRARGHGVLAPGINVPGELNPCPPLPRRTSSTLRLGERSASTWSRCRSCAAPRTSTGARAHAPAADRQDREAAGGRSARRRSCAPPTA
jgi:hypothetical protein